MSETKEQQVWIIGASQGIGAAIATLEMQQGNHCTLVARNIELLEQVAQASDKSAIVSCDLLADPTAASLREYCGSSKPQIDRLYLNVGGGQVANFAEQSVEAFEHALDINLRAQTRALRALEPYLSDNATVVSVNSVAGFTAFPGWSAYCAAKAGLRAFFDAYRQEVAPRIRVLSAFPYATDTPYWDNVPGDWDRSKMMSSEQVARTIASAASSDVAVQEIRFASPYGAL